MDQTDTTGGAGTRRQTRRARRWLGAGLACVLTLAGITLVARAGDRPAWRAPGNPPPNARGFWQGEDAVTKLGDPGLQALSARLRVPAAGLEAQLRTDSRLSVDAEGELMVSEPVVSGAAGAAESGSTTSSLSSVAGLESVGPYAAAAVVAQATTTSATVPALHSRAGATKTLYLNFSGASLAGTVWDKAFFTGTPCAGTAVPGFSLDGDARSYTPAEQAFIAQVWVMVSEDFAPFAVDVTTERPAAGVLERSDASDLRYGSTALITNPTQPCTDPVTKLTSTVTPYQLICASCGGYAWIGHLADTGAAHEYYQPALVFQNGLGGVNALAKVVGDATSHELGHTAGLLHDGATSGCAVTAANPAGACEYYTGEEVWGPLMGSSYTRPLSQWSRGEYPGATNPQDDLGILAWQLGWSERSPDGAASLPLDTWGRVQPDGAGGVSTSSYPVTVEDGQLEVTVTPAGAGLGANLDTLVRVLDAGGVEVARADPRPVVVDRSTAAGLGAELTVRVAPGAYTVTVTGTGTDMSRSGGYPAYGSVGQYHLQARFTPLALIPPRVVIQTEGELTGAAPLSIALSAGESRAADGGTLSYRWQLPDGTVSTAKQLRYTQATPTGAAPGVVSLTVTNAAGVSDTARVRLIATAGEPDDRFRTVNLAFSEILVDSRSSAPGESKGEGARILRSSSATTALHLGRFSGVFPSTTLAPTVNAGIRVWQSSAGLCTLTVEGTTGALEAGATTWASAPVGWRVLGSARHMGAGSFAIPLDLSAMDAAGVSLSGNLQLRVTGSCGIATKAQALGPSMEWWSSSTASMPAGTTASWRQIAAPYGIGRYTRVTGLAGRGDQLLVATQGVAGMAPVGAVSLRTNSFASQPVAAAASGDGVVTMTAVGEAVWAAPGRQTVTPLTPRTELIRIGPGAIAPALGSTAMLGGTAVRAVTSLTGTDVWAVGRQGVNGVVWRSQNGGRSWQRQLVVAPRTLGGQVSFGFLVAHQGRLYTQAWEDARDPSRSGYHPSVKLTSGDGTFQNGSSLVANASVPVTQVASVGDAILMLQGHTLVRFDGTTSTAVRSADGFTVLGDGRVLALDGRQLYRADASLVFAPLGPALPAPLGPVPSAGPTPVWGRTNANGSTTMVVPWQLSATSSVDLWRVDA